MTNPSPLPKAHVFMLDAELKTPASAFAVMAPDLEAQLREDVAPIWGVGNGDTVETFDSGLAEITPIRVHATAPQDAAASGAEAEHAPDGIDVFEDLLLQFGIGPETPTIEDALSVAISHELVENRNDETCDRTAVLPDGRTVAVEVCDQVQAQPYVKGKTRVSNFNTPSNFGIGGNAAPFDFLGNQTVQFQCEPGGYEQVFDPTLGWQMITAERVLSSTIDESSRVRAAIDAMPMGMLRYRAELAWRNLGRHAKRKRRHHAKKG